MNLKKILTLAIILLLVIIVPFGYYRYEKNRRVDVKIPVLLYHNFVDVVPNEDADGFKLLRYLLVQHA